MTDTELAFVPAYKLAELIRNKELSPVELVDFLFQRISVLNPKLNAYLTVTEAEAKVSAAAAEKALATKKELPPLHGVPVAIKDTEYTKGIRTTSGSLVYQDFVPDEDSISVERLRAAGAIILGKTNAPEFAYAGKTYNRLGDYCRNPWQTDLTPGGSSGGSAAAVAAGLSPLATGSDVAGSIRMPAALCGVYGIKPTHGRIPFWPSMDAWPMMLDCGPITRTVRDSALMLNIMAGYDSRDPMSIREKSPDFLGAFDGPALKLRVAWSSDLGFATLAPEVRSIFEATVGIFESLGCTVEDANITLEDPLTTFMPILYADEAASRGHLLDDQADQLTPMVRQWLEDAQKVTGAEYSDALRGVFRLRAQMAEFFKQYDVLLTPTVPVTAFPALAETIEVEGKALDTEWDTAPFTPLWNMTGMPAASLPCGFDSDGLPVGLQVIGEWGDEVTVFKACAAFEQARPWVDKIPPIAQF